MAKRYWLKTTAHFFKDSHMIYLKSQKNGYEYIYLWQSLLLKSLEVDDEAECGFLRLNEKIPYSPELLSDIFSMNIDVVKAGIDLFVNLGMVSILNDGTLYIESVQKMIGRESDSAERVRKHREKAKLKAVTCNVTNVKTLYNTNKEEEKEEEVEKEVEKEKEIICENFEEWWVTYDKKRNKINAIKEWNKLNPDNNLFNKIMQHTFQFVRVTEKQFRPDPERYLKNKRFEDEIIIKELNKGYNDPEIHKQLDAIK